MSASNQASIIPKSLKHKELANHLKNCEQISFFKKETKGMHMLQIR